MKKTLILGLSLLTIGTAVTPGTIGIVAYANEDATVSSSFENPNKLDEYVVVENNQYKFELPSNVVVNDDQVKQVNDSIAIANKQIQKENAILDPTTKTYTTWSYRSGGYTSDNFWWGTRYYFRSNAAVAKMTHDLNNYSIVVGLTGAIGGLASAGIGSVVGAIGAAYFQKMSNDLNYYNNTHINDRINMDVYFTGIYKIYSV